MSQHIKFWKILLFLSLGLFTFLYIVGSTAANIYFLINDPVFGIMFKEDLVNNRLVVQGVVTSGPAYQAGIQQGDNVLQINDVKINNYKDQEQAYNDIKIGSPVKVLIERSGQQQWVSFVPDKKIAVYSSTIFTGLLPAIVFCYSLCLMGLFVFFKKIEDRTAHIFYLMVLFWALAMWDIFAGSEVLWRILPKWLSWIRMAFLPLATGLFLHFTLIFPQEKERKPRHKTLFFLLGYGILIPIIPALYSEVMELGWGWQFLAYVWGIWITVIFGVGFSLLKQSIRSATNPRMRDQAKLIYRGTMVTLAIPIGLFFLPSIFLRLWLPELKYILLLTVLWPIALAYAIIKHRFMDINIIIKHGVAYALLSGFVVAAYFIFVIGAGKLVLLLTGSNSQFVAIVATLVIAAFFNPVKNKIQLFVDRRFFPNRFVYQDAIRGMNHKLVNIVDLQKLQDLVQAFLIETIKAEPVVLIWLNEKAKTMNVIGVYGLNETGFENFSCSEFVLRQVCEKKKLIDYSLLKETPDLVPAPEQAKWDRLKTEIILPLLARGELKGVISLGAKKDGQAYYKEDIDLLETLTDQVNIALTNALLTEELREQDRMKKELEVARRIQLSSLPQGDPEVPGLEVSGISIPALEVGGDYYDYLRFADGRFGVVVGDVSGKGTSAALYMSQLKGILNTAAKFFKSLKALLIEVNDITFHNMEEKSFITLTCGAFDTKKRKFQLVRAGHLPLIHYSKKDNVCHELVPKGIGLGLEKGILFSQQLEETEIKFVSGDVFLFYSDGLTDVRNAQGEELQMSMLTDVLHENGACHANELRERIISRVKRFSQQEAQHDDMTLVVVKIK